MTAYAEADVRVVPANEVTWDELQAVLGSGDPGRCQCQRFKVLGWMWTRTTQAERSDRLREQTGCESPENGRTSGLVAFVGEEPVGWVAVEPRTEYAKLRAMRVPWTGRSEDQDDEGVWAVTCFVVRPGFRGRGLMYHLARAAAEFAGRSGARAVEGYPLVVPPGKTITWGELHVGARQAFEEAGFAEVSRPTVRRVVMRIDFDRPRRRRRSR